MIKAKRRILKKTLKVIENDLDVILISQRNPIKERNPIFIDFDNSFKENLGKSNDRIVRLQNSIHNTKK